MNRVIVLCEANDCVYFMHDAKEGPAYQNYCDNDEIEMGYQGEFLRYYSYDKEVEKEAVDE